MGFSSINDSAWKKLLASFREQPENVNRAATSAGVKWEKAKEALDRGFPNRKPALKPIRVILAEEAAAAQEKAAVIRSETEAFAAQLRASTRDDALDVHDQEGRVVKAARVNAANLLSAAARLPPALVKVAERVAIQLAQPDDTLSVDKQLETLNRAASVIEKAVKVGQTVLEMERLFRGDPTKIIGIVPAEEMSLEEARRLAQEAYEAAQRYERNGLEVIDGGAESGPVVTVQAGAQ